MKTYEDLVDEFNSIDRSNMLLYQMDYVGTYLLNQDIIADEVTKRRLKQED